MTEERIQKLESIGFRWVVGKGKALRSWEEYFRDLVVFREKVCCYSCIESVLDNFFGSTIAIYDFFHCEVLLPSPPHYAL